MGKRGRPRHGGEGPAEPGYTPSRAPEPRRARPDHDELADAGGTYGTGPLNRAPSGHRPPPPGDEVRGYGGPDAYRRPGDARPARPGQPGPSGRQRPAYDPPGYDRPGYDRPGHEDFGYEQGGGYGRQGAGAPGHDAFDGAPRGRDPLRGDPLHDDLPEFDSGAPGRSDPLDDFPDTGRTVIVSGADGPAPTRTGTGRADRRRLARRIQRRRRRSALREIPLLIGVAIVIALVLKTFLVQAFVIPSGSMENTIQIGDRVLVDKLTPWFGAQPHRGDVVVFKDPGHWLDGEQTTPTSTPPAGVKQLQEALTFIGLLPSNDERDLIKRVVAVGGDTVKCCDSKGRVTVNGTPLSEPYIHPGNKPSDFAFSVVVPPGRLFVMGDHRADSADSRYHRTLGYSGTVSVDSVVGRARVIAWPIGHWRSLDEPGTFASVPDARSTSTSATGTSHRVASADQIGKIPLPTTPAELPLVMGVVGLYRIRDRRRHGLRSGCGGCGGRCAFRIGRPGGPAGMGLGRTGRRLRGALGRARRTAVRAGRPRHDRCGRCGARTRRRGGRRDAGARSGAR